jgi:spore germination cell wall hydrolase CwlJ-like protein
MRGRRVFGAAGIALFVLAGCHRSEDAQSPVIEPPKPTEQKAQDLEQRAAAGDSTAPLSDLIKKPEAQAVDPTGKEPLAEPLTCLARTVYWEARGESKDVMEAVANVVMNRLAQEGFPKSICDVVKQGHEKSTCQFSWWCDGRSDHAREDAAYATAKEIARRALNLELTDRTSGALYFHQKTVAPSWSEVYVKTTDVGVFEFYRPPARNEVVNRPPPRAVADQPHQAKDRASSGESPADHPEQSVTDHAQQDTADHSHQDAAGPPPPEVAEQPWEGDVAGPSGAG